jgi:C-terminal processing protease CtpA/Prc
LTVNTANSPRLVPSGADLWAEWQQGKAIVGQVRENSDAQRAGISVGAEILALNDVPIDEALRARIGRSLRLIDDDVRSWALRAVLAGRHDQPRQIQFRIGGSVSRATLPAADQFTNRKTQLTSRMLPSKIGYIRLHDSLGDLSAIGEFDSALAHYESSAGLILDLRDTPSGGNTTVARAILGRFVRTERPYQKHLLPSEERETGVRRSWLELVTPRGPFRYAHSVVVLVGRWTGSMGEGLAIGFDAVEAATIVGTPMAQLSGATYHFELPQSHFGMNIPAERLFHVNGTAREAFVPRVRLTLEELTQSSGDPWMTKALLVLNDGRR